MDNNNNKTPAHKLSLEETRLSKRWPSWLLFAVILSFFLLLPIASLINKEASTALRNSPLPSDNAWTSGQLSPPHQIPELNQNCDACHVKAFEVVQDSSCLTCHADTNHHFDLNKPGTESINLQRCASCHREHNEPAEIVHNDDRLCTDCHRNLSSNKRLATELLDVDSFGRYARAKAKAPHPAIKVTTLVPTVLQDEIKWSPVRIALSSKPVEHSNLKFPHDVHVDPAGIDSPSGLQVLACDSCHVNDGAGKLMQDISMETHCRDCHTLSFDPDAPEREVPHGKTQTVLLTLEEYYARQYLLQELGRTPTAEELADFMLRRPGKSVQRRVDRTLELSSPWGKAVSVAEEIFERTTCKTCHDVDVRPDQPPADRWHVQPVRITPQWMPKSDFDHFSHRSFDCGLCHAASDSSESQDVLMPDLPVCESCHTGMRSHESKLPSSCNSCHQFHLPGRDQWHGAAAHESSPTQTMQTTNVETIQ